MLVFRCEASFPLVQNLEDPDDFLFRTAQRDAEDIPRVISGDGVNGGIKQRRFVGILDDDRFARDQHGAGYSEPRVEPKRIGYSKSDFCPELAFLLIQHKDSGSLGINVFRCLIGDELQELVEILFGVEPD